MKEEFREVKYKRITFIVAAIFALALLIGVVFYKSQYPLEPKPALQNPILHIQ